MFLINMVSLITFIRSQREITALNTHTEEFGFKHSFSRINGQVASFLFNKMLLSKRLDTGCVR